MNRPQSPNNLKSSRRLSTSWIEECMGQMCDSLQMITDNVSKIRLLSELNVQQKREIHLSGRCNFLKRCH